MPINRKVRRGVTLGLMLLAGIAGAIPARAAPPFGTLTGIVVDPAGTPQMGATIVVASEDGRTLAPLQLLSNQKGLFSNERLLPGLYSVRVTLAGFLPAIERHIRVQPNLATLLRIELGSVFSSIERLRRRPDQALDADEWAWVLRTSPGTRPVLRWVSGEVLLEGEATPAETSRKRKPHGRVEVTAGARRPGSASNLADAPSSAFAYDQKLGHTGRLLLAGQMNYERSAAAGFATTWLPSGELGRGPQTTAVLRQSKLGPAGPTFRGLRLDHGSQVSIGERFEVRYGAEYIRVSMVQSTSSVRPRAELVYRASPNWRGSLIVASRPWAGVVPSPNLLEAALDGLDALPTMMLRGGRPMLEGGWHQEIAVERKLGGRASLVVSAFRDRSRHTAIFGRGLTSNSDFLQDFFSDAFVYDGGESNSWGTRVAYRQKFSDEFDAAVIYAWAGVLTPEELASAVELRDALESRNRHSLAARVSSRLPWWGTQLTASYKWVNGTVVSRQDAFGELAYQVDPNLNLSVRQPLPTFVFLGRFEALADFRNLLARGYVPMNTPEGQVVLIPAQRSFRGGFSFQF